MDEVRETGTLVHFSTCLSAPWFSIVFPAVKAILTPLLS